MKRTLLLMALASMPLLALGTSGVVDTVHNLSISGPGEIKSESVDQVCVFCHTPHRALKGRGLWNRPVTSGSITPYTSPRVSATSESLSGPSALCMSCHDGTVALGNVLTPPGRARGTDLRDRFLSGRSRFGSNLSNHHPIGLDYVSGQQSDGSGLVDQAALNLKLTDGQVHCTSCHDPHSSRHPPFLVEPSSNGALCLSCHTFSGSDWDWSRSAHARSTAEPRTGNPWRERKPEWVRSNVAENACENCHATHNATSAVMLTVDNEEQTCYRCHNGSVAALNMQSESQKFYRHPVDLPSGRGHREENIETTFSTPLHVECEDCHNPHAVRKDEPMISFNPGNPTDTRYNRAPLVNGYLLGVSGLDINGQSKHEADYEYEVCFKCHGVRGRSSCENSRCSTATNLQMARQDETYNLREKFDSNSPSLESYHPVYNNDPSNDFEVPSLRLDIPLQREGSLIYCGDCHGGDFSPSAGGNGASGPHGSRHAAMVSLRYALDPDAQANWTVSSALCFKCHDQSNLFSDESFLHSLHVVGARKGCVNCHDPHGSNVYPHLINFLTSASSAGRILEITGAGSVPQTPFWIDKGRYSGTCWLNCHGVVHEGSSYGMAGEESGF